MTQARWRVFELRLLQAMAAAVLAFAAWFPPGHAFAGDSAPAEYRLGIFPYMAPRQTIAFFGPVASSMARALGHPVKLESVPTFGDFLAALSRQSYDIALIQPFHYPEVVEKQGYIPLAQMSVPLVTQFFVRSDSRYQKLEDLRGTVIAMPPADAANSRMAMRALNDNKLMPGRDVEVRYFTSHDSCLQQAWAGLASACVSTQPPVLVFERRMQATLRPIYDTPAIPHVLFVAHPRVPSDQRAKLQTLIVDWAQTEEGRALLANLGYPGFVPARPSDYVVMRNYDSPPTSRVAKTALGADLTFGVFPFLAPRQLAQNMAPALPALARAASLPVHLRTAANYDAFSDAVASGAYDVVLVQPFSYANATRAGYLPLARMKDPLQGAFWVREQSRFHTLADFKGEVVAMAPMVSTQARLGTQALERAGLRPGHEVTIHYRPTHDSCLREVQQRAAAACVTTPLTLKMLPPEFTRDLRAVGETLSVPGVAILAHPRLPQSTRERLRDEIISWQDTSEGRKILHSLGFGAFVPIEPRDYESLANIGVPR